MKMQRPTLLIIDDYPANIQVLGAALGGEYEIIVATSGEEGLALAKSTPGPDLILLDISMPGMDGYEVCRRLKAERWTRKIPVIFITANTSEEEETKGLELGAVDYITKPFGIPIVQARIRTHLELKRHQDILENLSYLDGLTGIANRRRFEEHFGMAWRLCIRQGTALSLVMIDLDHFKAYNDKYGHQAGDICLRRVAKSLCGWTRRPIDLVARYGGEEFVCIYPGSDWEGAEKLAESLRVAVEEMKIEHKLSPVADHVTISLGVASCKPADTDRPEDLLAAADEALYEAKKGARNRVITRRIKFDLQAS
jgi:diguanylate cyclase (GGDEF)-like protein